MHAVCIHAIESKCKRGGIATLRVFAGTTRAKVLHAAFLKVDPREGGEKGRKAECRDPYCMKLSLGNKGLLSLRVQKVA